jgi:hypothetical protein
MDARPTDQHLEPTGRVGRCGFVHKDPVLRGRQLRQLGTQLGLIVGRNGHGIHAGQRGLPLLALDVPLAASVLHELVAHLGPQLLPVQTEPAILCAARGLLWRDRIGLSVHAQLRGKYPYISEDVLAAARAGVAQN